MARLIPRKQIEEQQDISSSLNIRQDVNVGNNAIISGSLFVSKSFFLGNDENDRNEITGSVFLTGSLTIDGNLFVGAPDTILSFTSSFASESLNTQRYAGILAKDFGANVPTLYVSSTDGDDTNDGRSIQFPLRTIKRAAALAAPGYDGRYGFDTGSIYNGYVIKVQAGTYLEDNPVILPKNTTIWGAGLRITKINAKNPEQDLFWVNSGCYIAEVTMGGLRLWPNEKEPERGFGVAFQPGAFITTSPYVQNCSQISNQENSFTELYEEIPPGGGGLYVNGDVIDPDSPLASMVLDAYTQISPNGVGCLVNGRGFIQLVSFFNNFSYYAIRVNNGGHATLNNSNISFGLYGMYASGSRFISGSGGNIEARDKVRAGWSVVVDVLNRGLDALPEVTTLNTAEGIKTTAFTQSYLSGTATASAERAAEVVADFNLVSTIVENGPKNFPTLLARSSNKGYGFDSPYNILGQTQITSSIASASAQDVANISSSFGVTLGIFADGTGSYNYTLNTANSIKVTNFTPVSMESNLATTDFITGSVSSSFSSVITILRNGVSTLPTLVSNNSASVYVNDSAIEPFSTGTSASLQIINSVSASLSIVYNILANGTGSNILPIPVNHKREFIVTNNNSSSYQIEGVGANPTLTLFRGETYKFYVSASEAIGGIDYPFYIRTIPYEGISDIYDYNKGVINNGDSVGNITFTVPYDAPNTLYYTSQIDNNLGGKLNIVNNINTPRDLIANTLTYPATILSSSIASDDTNIINAYDILIQNIPFIQEETILFLSSSWSDFDYNQETCKRDISFIISGSAKDLLYGGNEESIRSGLFYYQYPSEATTTQLSPTLTAVKYASGLVDKLLRNTTFKTPNQDREYASNCIFNNREFIQNETIAYLSSSWSTFEYNEEKCKRDVGYILDAVATDLKYEGNERSIEAGRFYYLYPSQATGSQLIQTIDGIKYAAGVANKLILNSTYQTASLSTLETYNLIRDNKALIQDETIQFINVAFPTLEYNQAKCRRDVGYILDGVATDLLYGGNERSVASGRFYYDFPSVATSTQKRETAGGIRYAKIITETIVQNIILDTPRIIFNDEKNIKVTAVQNITSSISGTINEKNLISSSFAIVEGIVKKGVSSINSIIAQNTNTNWSLTNPINVSNNTQVTNSYISPSEINKIGANFDIVTAIISNGTGSLPTLTASIAGLYKVTGIEQIAGTAATNAETGSISSSFAHIIDIIKNGTGSLQPFTSSVQNNIKATATSYSALVGGTSSHSGSVSSSMKVITDVLTNGLGSLPSLVLNSTTGSLIKVSDVAQVTTSSLDSNLSASLFVSRSIAVVVDILRTGNIDVAKTAYVTQSFVSDKQSLASSHIVSNLEFIKAETIAYLSSSWSAFEYDEEKCKRDVGLIISGAAQDLYWGNISASVVNGQFYFEYPSQATGSQLQQTIDGIIYASNVAQKVIQGINYQQLTGSLASASLALKNNKGFIIDETIAYMSSSWGSFDYNEVTCRRDLNYIIDSVRTDLVYGGNQRTRLSAEYYFLYPSDATGSQLIQTTDAINYASRIAQKVVVGEAFTSADTNKLNASNLLSKNKNLIANEVVAYVSSSWSNVFYNEDKCKRDVGYLIDAVRTDLVYGGNERSNIAGLFYYLYPSSATVAGVPSPTAQLDMTVTGMKYASALSQRIALNQTLQTPPAAVLAAANLVRADIPFIQQNVIDFTNDTFPSLNYNQAKCFRDVRFITDAVITDLVYGGNERSLEAGTFYYLYPSQATDDQLDETVSAINFGRDLTKLVAIGGLEVERSFDTVAKIIASGSAGYPSTLIKNTESAIKATNKKQFFNKDIVSVNDKTIVSSSFSNVINIISNGTGSIPTIVSSSLKGVARIAGSQMTSSISVEDVEKNKLTGSFETILDIVENGLGVIPTITSNVNGNIKVTSTAQFTSSSAVGTQFEADIISSSFGIVMSIVTNGTGSFPTLSAYSSATTASNAFYAYNLLKQNISFIQDETIAYLSSSWSTASYDESKCRRDVGLIVSGAAEDLIFNSTSASYMNGYYYYLYPSLAETAQLNQTLDGIKYASGLAQKIVQNTALQTASLSARTAYNLILENKEWIQNQTIAKINANLSTLSYNELTCRRDVGYILDAVATDILYGGNERSVEAGRYYYLYPSQATGSQLEQTLEGIGYAKTFADKVIANEIVYQQITSSITPTSDEINKVKTGFDIVMDIISNGTSSLPTLITNATGSIKRTTTSQYISASVITQTNINSVKNSFDVILDIVENGTGSLPLLVKNTNGLTKVTNAAQTIATSTTSRSVINGITSSFDTIISILQNGTGSLPTNVKNTASNIKRTITSQYIGSGSATSTEATAISASIGIVVDIVKNGIGSLPVITEYVTASNSASILAAYDILIQNIPFIQEETIAYLSSSWSTHSYDETKCKRDIGYILSGSATDLLYGANSASVINGKYYYLDPSQATGYQLNETLDGIRYASELAQKVVLNTLFVTQSVEKINAYNLIRNNREFIQSESIAYISSSWSTHEYNQQTCKRDISYIIDAVTTDLVYGGNERAITAGVFYYLYPSQATGSQIEETVTGINYAKNITDRILRGGIFQNVSQNKKDAYQILFRNKNFIANEVIAYVSASWNGFVYNEETCKRDVGYIIDAVATDLVYGGNERSVEAGRFYYDYPSEATTTQLGPTLSGIKHAKGLSENVLKNLTYTTASAFAKTAYELLVDNKDLIQTETIGFLNSAWSFFEYSESKCRRDIGYIIDAVATDILYGGNERVREAGEYYYLYPSLATVDGDGDAAGQLGQTLDGVKFAKGLADKIVQNIQLSKPTKSELAGWDLLFKNKPLIQAETIAYLSSSWTGVDGFYYNEASCSRDVAYIVDNVATDLVYGGNERSSKAGEYYYLYPSKAIVGGVPSVNAQKEQTVDGVAFAAGVAQNVVSNRLLTQPTEFISSSVSLMRQNRTFIQNETIQFIDAFYPYLVYNREKCRRDVGYIVDNVSTDLWYGGNERGFTAGRYYYLYPSLATQNEQVIETVAGVNYAKNVSKKIVQNIKLVAPTLQSNIANNIKVSGETQYTSSISAGSAEVNKISSSIALVTQIVEGGLTARPAVVSNTDNKIKVTSLVPVTSSISASVELIDIITSSFKHVRDVIYGGENSIPDSLVKNYNYGFELTTPKLWRITNNTQLTGSGTFNAQTASISSSYGSVINIVKNGLGSLPTLITNTSASIKETNASAIQMDTVAGEFEVNRISNAYNTILSIIENGTSVTPTFVSNTSASIKVTSTPQFLSGSGADRIQAKIVSSSFGVVSKILQFGTASVTYVNGSGVANTNNKVNLAYNLLLSNKQMIVDETISYMSSSWSTFVYNEASCSRDLGFIIDGAAYDLLYGGNSASYINGKFYYDYPSEATGSQLDQTLTAIKYASGIAEKVVRNVKLNHISGSTTTSASWASLRANKGFIQSESIAYLSSSWSDFDYNETTCKRDIGYIVDAVATDLLYGGNERSIVAGRYYYDFPSQATSTQLEPTLTGVRYAKGTSINVVKNVTFGSASFEVSSSYARLRDNKSFIQSESLAYVNAKYPNLDYNQSKCIRDLGYIIDAVATDLKWGGNEQARKAGEFYYLYPSAATGSQLAETTDAIVYAARLSAEIINSNVIPTPEVILNTSASIKVTNTAQYISASSAGNTEINHISSSYGIVTNIIRNGLGVIPTLYSNVSESIKVTSATQNVGTAATSTEATYVSASIGIVADIVKNGTGSLPTLVTYTTPSVDTNVINAYNNLKNNITFIQEETIAYISSSWNGFVYDETKCKRDVGFIVSGAAEDLLYNANSASIANGVFYYEYPSQAQGSQLNQTLDGIKYASRLAQKIVLGDVFVTASEARKTTHDILRRNKEFVQNETIAYVSSSWSFFVYNEASCSRDTGYILDAVATDVLYGGNERSSEAGRYYYLYPSAATGSQLEQTLDGIIYSAKLAEKLVKNVPFVTASNVTTAVYTALRANREFIVSESIQFVSSSWNGFAYNQDTCGRDIRHIIDAVSTDMLYGGNERSSKAGEYYFKYPSTATTTQLEPTVTAIDYASGLAKNVVQNATYITASSIVSASFDLLRKNRAFIQSEVMEYLTASWSTFQYDKVKCKRDVGYILDAATTDLLYGGNERSVEAGRFYYLYPSKATLLGDGDGDGQLKQTIDGIVYASKVAQKVIQNVVFQTASLEVSASFDLLRKNKPFIAAETIAYVSSSWSTVVYNEASCSRDVGYIIDAAATDLLYGGTERSIIAGKYYYLFPSRATNAGVPSETNQLDPTVTGIRYAGKLAAKSVLNPVYTQSFTDNTNARTLLQKNRLFIQKETIAFLSSSWSTLQYNEVSCSRDIGFILDAVATDLVYGGNERSIEAGSYYYKIPSVAIKPSYTDNGNVGQLKQTVDGINFARGVAEKAVLQTQLTFPPTKRREAYQRLLAAKDELKQRAIGYTNGAFPYLVYNEASCSRDTGLIVDAVATDLLYGGNERSIAAASSYYTGQYKSAAVVINEQKLETLETNRYLRTRAEFVAAGAPLESFGSLIVATGIDYSYNGSGVTFKALPPNQGGSGVANPIYEITELAGGRIYFTSGNQDGDFRIGTGLSINQATGTLVGRTFSKSLFSLVTPFSLALEA